jgi:hypothetical protein
MVTALAAGDIRAHDRPTWARKSRWDRAMTAQLTPERTQVHTTERATSTSRGLLRGAFHRIDLAIREMNYASRRMVELQVPWIADKNWYRG